MCIFVVCNKESHSELRLREEVDSMRLTVTCGSDAETETDMNECTERIAALHALVYLYTALLQLSDILAWCTMSA